MWSITVLGLIFSLSVPSILVAMFFSILASIYFLLVVKEKNTLRINYVSIFLIVIGSIQISAFYFAFQFPPIMWDEVAYGAALPKLYANSEQFFYAENYGPYSAFPQNFEAISTASILIFDSLSFSKFLNYLFVLGLLVVVGGLGTIIGLPKIFAILGGSMVCLSSALITYSPTVKNDIANGFFQSTAVLMLMIYCKERTLQNCVLMGIFIGTAIGIKYNSLLFSISPLLVFFWMEACSDNSLAIKFKKLSIVGLTIAFTALPWYLNNYVHFSNPVYPIANSFFGSNNDFHSGYSQLFKESFYSDLNFSWDNGSVYYFFKRLSSEFTAIVLVSGLIGVLINLFYYEKKPGFYLAVVTLAYLFLNIRFGHWEPRYSFVLLALLATHSAVFFYFISKLFKKCNLYKVISLILFITCIVTFTFAGYAKGKRIYGEHVQQFKTQSSESFLKKYVSGYEIADWLNKNTSKDAVIAVWGNQMFYYLDRPYFHIHPLTESGNFISIQNQDDFYKFLEDKNISYLCLADWRFNLISDRTPGLKNFFLRLNLWVQELENQGKITQVKVLDESRIYEISKKGSRE